MANKYISQSRAEHTRVYPTFAGVDFSSDPADVEPHRFAYIKNMWRDYGSEQGGAVETVPGFRSLGLNLWTDAVPGRVRGIGAFESEDGKPILMWIAGNHINLKEIGPELDNALDEDLRPISNWKDVRVEKYAGAFAADETPIAIFPWNGGALFLDGTKYRRLRLKRSPTNEWDYECVSVSEDDQTYIPTTYADGKPYEQRNMLTDKFIHKYNLLNVSDYLEEKNEYRYEYDSQKKTATVMGFGDEIANAQSVDIPETTEHEGEDYTVTAIGKEAFASNNNIVIVRIPKTVQKIGEGAFSRCGELYHIGFGFDGSDPAAPKTSLREIGEDAFSKCAKLFFVSIPSEAETEGVTIGRRAFQGCGTYKGIESTLGIALTGNVHFFAPKDGEGEESLLSDMPFAGTDRLAPIVDSAIYDTMDESDPVLSLLCREATKQDGGVAYRIDNMSGYLIGQDHPGVVLTLEKDTEILGRYGTNSYDETTRKLDITNGVALVVYKLGDVYSCVYVNAALSQDVHETEYDYRFSVYDPAKSIEDVQVNGASIFGDGAFSISFENADGYVTAVRIKTTDYTLLDKAVLTLHGTAESSKFTTVSGYVDVINGNASYHGTAKEAIDGCRLFESFDGRIFLSGNPKLPNTVFYTHRDLTGANNPTYFGVLNFFNDGVGNEPITSLLATSSALCVLKGDTQNEGSVYYHTGADTGEDILPRIYPATQGTAGIGCLGASRNFLDDPVFISRRGLESIGKEQTNLERSIEHRSYNVDAKLCNEDLKKAIMTEWLGYLVIACEDRMYLADSRQVFAHKTGVANYEWYFLEGIRGVGGKQKGTGYRNKQRMFLGYSDEFIFVNGEGNVPVEDCVFTRDSDGSRWRVERATPDTLYGFGDPGYVASKNGYLHDVRAYPTGQRNGENFCVLVFEGKELYSDYRPVLTALCVVDDVLYFGTEGGELYCFNTDKREANGRIPEEYYSFGGVRYESAFALKADNCDIPGFTKKTSRGSFVLRTKPFRHSRIKARGRADRGELSVWQEIAASTSSDLDFNATAFDAFSFGGGDAKICIVRENFRRWYEKQLYFYTDGFCEPFGVYSASFRYTLQGKLKV